MTSLSTVANELMFPYSFVERMLHTLARVSSLSAIVNRVQIMIVE